MENPGSENRNRILAAVSDSTLIHSQLLAEALRRDRRIEVVGAVSTSHEFIQIVQEWPIHVAIISCSLEETPRRGFELLREIHRLRPQVRGVFLLESSNRETVVEAFRAGATGIFSRHSSLKNLCKCVRCVHEGQIWANSRDLTFALEALILTHRPIRAMDSKGISLLSKRELQVVQALAEGLTNREIGERLRLSRHTVKNYLLRIFDKVGVSNRMELLFLTLNTASRQNTSHLTLAPDWEGAPDSQIELPGPRTAGEHREVIGAYAWCLRAEQMNVGGARNEIVALRKKIAESMTAEQLSAADHKIVHRAGNLPARKHSSFTAADGGVVEIPRRSAKAYSAD